MEQEQIVEERQEMCSVVSKIVRIKIFRRKVDDALQQDGEIIGFECASKVSNCEKKCSYMLILDDF